MKNKITDFDLEQFVLGELSFDENEYLLKQIEVSVELQKRVEEIKKSNKKILADFPSHLMSAQIKNKVALKELSQPLFPIKWVFASSMVMMLTMMFIIPFESVDFNTGIWLSSASSERIKGTDFGMQIHKKELNSVKLLPDSAIVSQGDLLQISIKHLKSVYAMVLSKDGRGVVTQHFPMPGMDSGLKDQGLYVLPYSYELDDAPYFEKFYLITSDIPLSVDSLTKVLETNELIDVEQELFLRKGIEK